MLLLNMKQHRDCVKPSTHKEKKNKKKINGYIVLRLEM